MIHMIPPSKPSRLLSGAVLLGASLALATFAPSSIALAQGKTRIVGYGSVGYSLLVNEETPEGEELPYGDTFAGASKKGTFRNLTRFGLNITHEASESISMLLQLAANGADLFQGTDEEQQFNVRTNLAGLQLKFDQMEIMLGILPTSYFMISDTVQMGATYPSVQPPKIFYRVGNSFNVVGARMRNSIELGEDLLTIEILAGEVLYRQWFDSDTLMDNRSVYLYSLGLHFETGDHTIRLVATLNPEMAFRRSEFVERVMSPGTPPVRLETRGGCNRSQLDGINASYDGYVSDELRVQAEYVMRHTQLGGCFGRHIYAEKLEWKEQVGYLALAYSIGDWTPRLLFLKQNIAAEVDEAAKLYASRFPPAMRAAVRARLAKELGYRARAKTDSFGIGLNHQITPFIVAKGELEYYVAPDKHIRGYQMPVDSSALLFNIVLDYIF